MTKDAKLRPEWSMYNFGKRLLDIIISIIAIIFFSPVMIILAILIKLSSPGPVFADTPLRVGRYGKMFFMYKFRSMIKNAQILLTTDPKYSELYKKYKANNYKLASDEDPRVTWIGKFIRKTSLDELPQFFNVLKGEMSIVGPRAYYAFEFKEQAERYPQSKKLIQKVLTTKPGVTGPWQVGGRSEINFSSRIKMDAEYTKKKSIFYDILIMFKTPFAVLSRKGAL